MKLKMTGGTDRTGRRSARISFTIVASPLGRLLVAATPGGVCRVMIGDSDRALARELRLERPDARVDRGDAGLARAVRVILAGLRGRSPGPALSLDLQGTAFQFGVWRELPRIPFGRTRSYGQVAASVGLPNGARAAARACAANPVALLVPCHRVVRGDGSLGGYRWGVERKRALLELEREAAREGLAPRRRSG
jgi:AraC family transcriptional regulator, regulatory protein of adaptative response / methylated-DNA-[protein]-cysteine methyltransferase